MPFWRRKPVSLAEAPTPSVQQVTISQPAPLGGGIATADYARKDARSVTPFEERGVVGTPIVSGFVNELGEYNTKLYGPAGIRVYEEMRRGDAQVAATLATLKLPIRSGEPTIEPAGDTALDKEIAEFVEDNLISGLEYIGTAGQLVSQSWDDVVQNALLMLDFGCAAHEEVWIMDGDAVRLKKLAPRLPETFYRFLVEDDGETLIELQQYGYRGNNFLVTAVPAWKLGMFVFQKEGANFYGRSVLRSAYKHWYLKEALYKIDAIACERNGLGVPWIGHTDAAAPPLSVEDREMAFNFATKLAACESSGIYLPPGLTFKLVGVTGQVRNCHDAIQHHNEQISKTALAMFMDQGQASSGNRALGVSMQDFFFIAAQAVADQIARTLTHTTIRRMVDFNYDGIGASRVSSSGSGPAPKASGYPKLRAPQVKYVKLDQVVDALSKLALMNVDIVHPDDELEEWVRREMGMPDAKKPRTRFAPTAIRVQDQGGAGAVPGAAAAPGAAASRGQAPGTGMQQPATPQPKQAQADAAKGATAAPAGAQANMAASEAAQLKLRREPRGAETHMALSEIVSAMDGGKAKVAELLRAAKPAVIAEALHKAIAAPVGKAHQVSVAADPKLVAQIAAALRPLHQEGAKQVYAERNSQRPGAAPKNKITGKLAAAEGAEDDADEQIGLFAQATAAEFNNNLTQRAVNAALGFKKNPGDATKGQALVDAQDELEDAKDGWIDRLSSEAANEAFNAGRGAGFRELSDEIASYEYSSLLDFNTCTECEDADGKTAEDEEDLPDVPNPDCAGGDQCRCVHVATFSDETPSKA